MANKQAHQEEAPDQLARRVEMMQMPRYKCHKEVWALKIADIGEIENGSAMMWPEDRRYAGVRVDAAYVRKHEPKAGGYFVVYDDGYQSFSPAEAFESGYTLIQPERSRR